MPGYVSRLSAVRSLVFVSSLGSHLRELAAYIRMYQGHTIEERWTSIDVDSDFVEQYPRWSATQIMSVRSSIVVRGTCDRNKSVYDAVLRTL